MASQKVFGSYQEIIDLHTEANHVSAIGIHTPTGDTPRKMFKGYFDQYKKYKYLGASITLVPAARLPADPMGVSYNSTGQVEGTAMDPRDALNPIMFHGCHGDDMGAILNTLYGNNSSISDSVDGLDGGAVSITDFVGASLWINMERLYYKALTDKTWKKANPMSGFKKGNLRPLVYSLATNRQIMPYDGSPAGLGAFSEGGDPTTQIVEDEDSETWAPVRANNLQFFTPRLTRLGWMETRNVHAVAKPGIPGIDEADDIPEFIAQALDTTTTPAEMPKIYMGIILMAPAYGVEQYYRMIVNHRFAFKEFRGISFMPATDGVPAYTNANPDLFNGEQYEDWDSVESGGDTPEPTPTPTEMIRTAIFVSATLVPDGTEDGLGLTDASISYSTPDGQTVYLTSFNKPIGERYQLYNALIPAGSQIFINSGTVRDGTSTVVGEDIDITGNCVNGGTTTYGGTTFKSVATNLQYNIVPSQSTLGEGIGFFVLCDGEIAVGP